jgi:hypothetical protein
MAKPRIFLDAKQEQPHKPTATWNEVIIGTQTKQNCSDKLRYYISTIATSARRHESYCTCVVSISSKLLRVRSPLIRTFGKALRASCTTLPASFAQLGPLSQRLYSEKQHTLSVAPTANGEMLVCTLDVTSPCPGATRRQYVAR